MVQIKREEEQIKIRADVPPIEYQCKMMEAVSWLLPFEWGMEGELIYHKGKGKTIVKWLQEEPKREEILAMVQGILMIQQEIEQYLMDQDKLLWDVNQICWNSETKTFQMIYCPWDSAGWGSSRNFLQKLAKLLWQKGVNHKWEEEELILLIYRFNIAAAHLKGNILWEEWLEKEKRNLNKVKQEALDILTEKPAPKQKKRNIFQIWKEKFPIELR